MIECPKCKIKYTEEQPYCTNVAGGCLDYFISKIEYPETGGTFTHIVGMKYPFEGFPEKTTLGLNATVKRAIISTLKVFFNSFKRSPIKNAIYWLSEVYQAEYGKHQIDEKKLCKSSKEILRVGKIFVDRIKDENYRGNALFALWCVVMIWEMDTAYRFRGQDVLIELKKENNPQKEIVRLIKLGASREVKQGEELTRKWNMALKIIRIALFFPKIKRFLREFFKEIDLSQIKPSTSDLYYMARYFDYNFAGLPYEVRAAWKEEEDKDYKAPVIVDSPNIDVRPNELFYKLDEYNAKKMAETTKSRIMEEYKKRNDKIGNLSPIN